MKFSVCKKTFFFALYKALEQLKWINLNIPRNHLLGWDYRKSLNFKKTFKETYVQWKWLSALMYCLPLMIIMFILTNLKGHHSDLGSIFTFLVTNIYPVNSDFSLFMSLDHCLLISNSFSETSYLKIIP